MLVCFLFSFLGIQPLYVELHRVLKKKKILESRVDRFCSGKKKSKYTLGGVLERGTFYTPDKS